LLQLFEFQEKGRNWLSQHGGSIGGVSNCGFDFFNVCFLTNYLQHFNFKKKKGRDRVNMVEPLGVFATMDLIFFNFVS
jgi:hypothetical protein